MLICLSLPSPSQPTNKQINKKTQLGNPKLCANYLALFDSLSNFMFTANSMHHATFSNTVSMEFSIKAYSCIVLMAINVILCMLFYFCHPSSSFINSVYTSTELWFFKPYKIEKKNI